jgi:methylmalonyl-CoA mutase
MDPMEPDPATAAPLFSAFAAASAGDWEAAARESLKGASLEARTWRLLEGLELSPIQHPDAAAAIEAARPVDEPAPACLDGERPGAWRICQDLEATTLNEARAQLAHDAAREGRNWTLRPAAALRRGRAELEAWRPGLVFGQAGDLRDLLAARPAGGLLRLEAGAGWPALCEATGFNNHIEWLVDPYSDLLLCGKGPEPAAQLRALASDPRPRLLVSAVLPAEAGAHAAQELAFLFAAAAAGLRGLQAGGLCLEEAAGRLRLELGVGHEVFLQVAKLRAARLGMARLLEAFGLPLPLRRPSLHLRGLQRSQTRRDPWTNLLRASLQGFTAGLAGCDSLHLPSFVEGIGAPEAFHRRLAFNAQVILQDEAQLARVQDPLRGGWLVETLTDSLGRAAWRRFQQIEEAGGLDAVLAAGSLQQEIAATLETRRRRLAERRDLLVGSNQFANLGERLPDLRPCVESLLPGPLSEACAAAALPATLSLPTLRPARLAEPFEALRERAEALNARRGGEAAVYLAAFGPLTQHKARADYSRGFLACGGLEARPGRACANPQEAAAEAFASGCPVLVACSSDESYPEWIPAFGRELDRLEAAAGRPRTRRLLAGWPKEQIDAHRAAGMDDFIHLRADLPAVIAGLLAHLEGTA